MSKKRVNDALDSAKIPFPSRPEEVAKPAMPSADEHEDDFEEEVAVMDLVKKGAAAQPVAGLEPETSKPLVEGREASIEALKKAAERRSVVTPPPPPVREGKKMKVANNVRVAWKGQFIRLRKGDVVEESHYGPGCHERMIDAGVSFEEM